MSSSDDNNHHSQASWYVPDSSSHQGQTYSKHQCYQQVVNGSRSHSHHQYPHHQGHVHPYHTVPYGHQQHPYHYSHGSEDPVDDSIPSGMTSSRRDSFPYYSHYHPQHATPIQPPPNAYNGPPVSALVPRFPRGPSHMYNQNGYTPQAVHYDSFNQNSVSSFPPSTGGQNEYGTHSRGSMNSKDRRTSFGLPMISTNSNFLIPTPQHPSSIEMNDSNSVGSSVAIPVPPNNGKNGISNNVIDRISPSDTVSSTQESRCVNLLSKKFESGNEKSWSSSGRQVDFADDVQKKAATVQDASLLLGLSSDTSNNSSPATVPTLQDETETEAKQSPGEMLPKTCFPVPVPDEYPKRLSLPNDTIKLNALHCFIRADLLEIFVVEPSPDALKFRHAPSSSIGRVGFRCVHCAMARNNAMNSTRDDEAPMSAFYPKTVSEIYRLVTSWQRCHVRKCKSLPKDIRDKWYSLREAEKCRGKTAYWVDSAKKIGLVDCTSRTGGIRFDIKDEQYFANPIKQELYSDTIEAVTTDNTATDENSEPPLAQVTMATLPGIVKVEMISPRAGTTVSGSTPLGASHGMNKMSGCF